jgi:hypothetical protein
MHIFRFLLVCLGSSFAQSQPGSVDPFSREGICAFAKHLEAEGDPAAGAESARCLFLAETADGRIHPELRDKRIQALTRAGDPVQAHREYLAWFKADAGSIPPETAYNLGKGMIRADRDSLAIGILTDFSPRPERSEGPEGPEKPEKDTMAARMDLLQGAAWLRLGKVDSARAAIADASREGGKDAEPYVALFSGLADEYGKGIGKSKWVAGILSASVPGLGKAYAGRKMDGLATFITLAFFGWQAFDGYAHDGPSSIKGAIFAAAGTGLYVGNIHGSALAIDAENRGRRKAFGERVKFAVQFQLP